MCFGDEGFSRASHRPRKLTEIAQHLALTEKVTAVVHDQAANMELLLRSILVGKVYIALLTASSSASRQDSPSVLLTVTVFG